MDSVKIHMASTLAGFILDACFGDPHFLPHPVRGIRESDKPFGKRNPPPVP